MAIGDDWTDEDTFSVIPDPAYSIKVGMGYTNAKYTIPTVGEVRRLIRDLIDTQNRQRKD